MAKSDRKRAGDDKSPALSVAPSQAMFVGAAAAGVLAKKGVKSPAKRLIRATEMASTSTRGEIHRETGVTFGRDGQARFEISDHRAQITGTVPKSGSVALKNVLSHAALYSAVPSAADLTVSRGRSNMPARATLAGTHITLHPDLIDQKGSVRHEALPVLLHEVQHHVQDVEGFHNGGSPDDFAKDFPHDEKARKLGYARMAGEVEARLTQRRSGLTVEERRQFYPKGDVPLEDQNLGPKNQASSGQRNFIDLQGVKDAASNAFQQLFNKDMADNKPARFRKLDPRQITSDPNTFQFKSGGDSHGVTDRLKGVKSWDNVAAGKAVVYERANGELVIADGHQRLGLAKRLAGQGQKVNMDAYVLRERDGWSARDVYAYAALKNIKESSGQALDMAKVMRERPDLVNGSVPMSDAKVREAANLSKLSKPAFDMVVGGAIKPEYAAQVGARIGDTTRHADMLTEMAKANVGSAQHAGLYVDQALAAGSITTHQNSLFGEETNTRSLIAERAAVLDKALSSLKSDKRIFSLLEREAGTIEGAGNRLSHEANAARAQEAGNVGALVERLAKNRGPVSDMLEAAARQMAEGKKPQIAARSFVKAVGDTLKAGGMSALTGDAPQPHQMVNQNQTEIFGVPQGGHHVWDDKARTASANARKAKAKEKPMSKRKVRMMIDDQSDMMPKATTKDKIAAASRAKEAKGRTGDPANEGLFGSGMKQTDIVDAVKTHRAKQTKAETKGLKDSAGNVWKKHPGTDAWSVHRVDDEVKRIEGPPRKDFAEQIKAMSPEQLAAVYKDVIGLAPKKRASKASMVRELKARDIENKRFDNKIAAAHLEAGQTGNDVQNAINRVMRVDDEVKRIEGPRKPFGNLVRQSQEAAPAKTTSGKRGTQNAANLEAINANRKANAKGKSAVTDRPLAAAGLTSYRAKGEYGHIMIGATDHADALREARRSSASVKPESLEVWDGKKYVPASDANAPRPAKKGNRGNGTDQARARAATSRAKTHNDRVASGAKSKAPGSNVMDSVATGANGNTDADKVRRYTNRMKAAGTAKTDADLRTEALTRPASGVADRMRAKMNAKSDLSPMIDKLAELSGKLGEMSTKLDTTADAFRKVEAKPVKRGGGKVLPLLAPVVIGAAMVLASSKAKAEGRDTGGQIKEAAKEGVKSGASMAGFSVAGAAVTGGLMRAGLTAAKAIPAANVAFMGYGAVSEGLEAYRHGAGVGGVLKAVAKGAWDMSLPGMVVNTGAAVHEAFNAANVAYRGPANASPAPAGRDSSQSRRGWANPSVQAAAQAARGRTFNGFTRSDLQ